MTSEEFRAFRPKSLFTPPSIIAWMLALVPLLAGALVSSQGMLSLLRNGNGGYSDEMLLGATLFRVALVMLGLLGLVLSWLPNEGQTKELAKASISTSRGTKTILAVILLISTVMRLYQLNAGLWFDEILTYMNYARLPLGEVVSTYASENQHVLFSILARISFVAFGESAWALRLPAVLFGVGSVWALFLLSRQVSNDREALLSAALMAFSYHHIWFSQNARGYTGLLFWAILSSWLLLLALEDGRTKYWIWYAGAAALGMYTHLTMMFVIFGQLIIFGGTLFGPRIVPLARRWRGLLLGFGLAAFFTFLLYALVIPQVLATIDETQSVVSEWKNPLWTALELVNGIAVNFSAGAVVIGSMVAVAALIVFASGVTSYWRTNRDVVVLLFVPAVVGASLTIAMGHHLWPRFFFFSFGFGAIVVVRGIMQFGSWLARALSMSKDRFVLLGTALSLLTILVLAGSSTFAYGPKQDFEAAIEYVNAHERPGDSVVAVDLAAHIYEEFYGVDWPVIEDEEDLVAVRAGSQRTWLLYTFPPVLSSVYPGIMNQIDNDFEQVKSFDGTVREGTLFVVLADGEGL